MQEELEDRCAFIRQQLLESVDVVVPTRPPLFRNQIVDAYHQNVLIMAPIEDGDLAGAWCTCVNAPQIVVRDLSSGQDRAITDGRTATWRPVFSPDGTALVYISSVDDQYDLFTYDLITEQEHRLTDTTFDEWDPHFSPDGSHVVYAGHADDNWDLFLYDLENGTTIRLTESKGNEWDPSITPDGTSILFAGVFGLIEAIYSMPYPR